MQHDMTMSMAEGVVRRIDLGNGKITLGHGPIASIDMPQMTMVYSVKPPLLLNQIKVGDKVKFEPEDDNGHFVVTKTRVLQ